MDQPVSTEIVPRQSRTKRRESIPERLQVTISLWSIMRNCIGKEVGICHTVDPLIILTPAIFS